ncbi:MAG: precorrin-8X methylmutase [Halothece sp. Uz-M2-17]|nr:precorrin-8X methylmutase [Halothece sp. Uz-M2-17]
MELTKTEANSLLAIDQEVGKHRFSPAEYEIIRRVIYETGDFDYLSHLHFSDRALSAGAAALAARTAIVVDVPLIQAGIAQCTQNSFANPIYCHVENHRSHQLAILAKRFPEAIFIIGKEQTAFSTFFQLLEKEEIQPAFAIITPPKLVDVDSIESKLAALTIPHIRVTGKKGSASVAVGIFNGLVHLAWQVYAQRDNIPSDL